MHLRIPKYPYAPAVRHKFDLARQMQMEGRAYYGLCGGLEPPQGARSTAYARRGNMKISALVIAAIWLLCGTSIHAAPTLSLRNGNIVLTAHGASTVLPSNAFPVMQVEDAAGVPTNKLSFCGVGKGSGRPYGITPGLYLFGDQGALAGFIPTDAAEFCCEVRLSPGGVVLAMDSGTWLVRTWYFYTYPGLKGLGSVEYFQAEEKPGLLWNGDSGVLFSGMTPGSHHRQCDYDPCGPVSVNAYSFKHRSVSTLLQGTDLCDFTLAGSVPGSGEFSAEQLCLPSAAAWKAFPQNASVDPVTVNPGTFNQ